MGQSMWVHIDVDGVLRETDKAFLVSIGGEEMWLPKSQIADWEDYEVGDLDCSMSVTEFIAHEKGLS